MQKKKKKKAELDTVLYNLIESIRIISVLIQPFMHHTSKGIWAQIGAVEGEKTVWEASKIFGLTEAGTKVKKGSVPIPTY